jgi:hypothetical protein
VTTKTIRPETERKFAYNDWRNPRHMSFQERERLFNEYNRRINVNRGA